MRIQKLQRRPLTTPRCRTAVGSARQQGFTLLELIVVLVIMVLGFSAISINLFSGNETTELKITARDMVSALRYAKGYAQMSHQETTLTINFAENTYTVSGRDKVYEIPQTIDTTMHTGQSELSEGSGSIRFYPDGSSSGGWIKLERGKFAWRIDINWLTGQVELKDVVP